MEGCSNVQPRIEILVFGNRDMMYIEIEALFSPKASLPVEPKI